MKFCLQLATLAKFLRGKAFLRKNLNCHIFGTGSRRKIKLSEVSFQICQNFLREIQAKKFFNLNALLNFCLKNVSIGQRAKQVCATQSVSQIRVRRAKLYSHWTSFVIFWKNRHFIKIRIKFCSFLETFEKTKLP